MNEVKWREKQIAEHGTMHPKMEGPVYDVFEPQLRPSEYGMGDYETVHGHPFIVDKLGIGVLFDASNDVRAMAMAVDEYIRSKSVNDSEKGYNMFFDRFSQRTPAPMEYLIRNGEGLKVLSFLFQEAAIGNKLSSETYLKDYDKKMKQKRVEDLKNKLKIALKELRVVEA